MTVIEKDKKDREILVAILMGSDSDADKMKDARDVLVKFDVPYATEIISAHRTSEKVGPTVEKFLQRGCKVFICGAGWAAHLAGAVAAKTINPVIGVPLSSSPLGGGIDALFSTVQMPPGIPVATVAIDCSANGAYLALQILAIFDSAQAMGSSDPKTIKRKLFSHREEMARGVEKKNENLICQDWEV